MTLVTYLTTLVYLGFQFKVLIYHLNPTITQTTIEDFYTTDDKFSFGDLGFNVAFAFTALNQVDVPVFNSSIVYLQPDIRTSLATSASTNVITPLKFHTCTDEDLDEFFPPTQNDVVNLQKARKA